MERVSIGLIEYDAVGHFIEKVGTTVGEAATALETPHVSWVNVIGLHQIEIMEQLQRTFSIHPLLMEDILNTNQRPKYEQIEDYIFLIVKLLYWQEESTTVESEQLSIVVGENLVITFQEQAKDIFEPLRQRLRENKGRLRSSGADYLAYRLLDGVVDNYFLILESLGDQIEELEAALYSEQTADLMQEIHPLKSELLFIRKAVWPLREVIRGFQRDDSALVQEETLLYLRDVYEHTIQIVDTVETLRDIVSDLQDIYLSLVSNRMNEVMKVLTIIATIFIPLTFITGLYGMNFRFMPELAWRWGYPLVWAVIVISTGGLMFYFRRRKWL